MVTDGLSASSYKWVTGVSVDVSGSPYRRGKVTTCCAENVFNTFKKILFHLHLKCVVFLGVLELKLLQLNI